MSECDMRIQNRRMNAQGARERESRRKVWQVRADENRDRGEVQFSIGDDEDDDDEPAGYDNGDPVAIDSTVQGGSQADSRKSTDDDTARAENIPNGESGEPAKAVEPPTELVEVKHKVARGDTLMSIARKYASDVSRLALPTSRRSGNPRDHLAHGRCLSITTQSIRAGIRATETRCKLTIQPHDLLKLNKLPSTALSTNPRILQTRRELVVSRRYICAQSASGTQSGASELELSGGGLAGEAANVGVEVMSKADAEEKERRQAERTLKRFQLLTKTEDPAVGRVYLALAQEGLLSGTAGSGEREMGNGEGDETDKGTVKVKAKDKEAAAFEAALANYVSDLSADLVKSEHGCGHGHAQGDDEGKDMVKEKRRAHATRLRVGGARGKEQDALDAFYSDEEWAATAGTSGPSRVGRAGTRTTSGSGSASAWSGSGSGSGIGVEIGQGIGASLGSLFGFGGARNGSSHSSSGSNGVLGTRWTVSPSTGI